MYLNEKAAPGAYAGPASNAFQAIDKVTEKNADSTISPSFDEEFFTKEAVKNEVDLLAQSTNTKSFPIAAFPADVQNIITALNNYVGFNTDYVSASLFFVAASCIGNTYKLYFKSGWVESAILWMVLVGGRGTNKSGPPKWALKPVEDLEKKRFKEYEAKMAEYNELLQLYRNNKEAGEPPVKPILQKMVLSDYTQEALYAVHSYNKRGLCLYVDEFAGLFKNFNKYNSGSEQEAWLTKWSGGSVIKDRLSKEPIRLENPFVPIFGTLQPVVLSGLAKGDRSENGFTDRLLFVKPENVDLPTWDSEDLPAGVAERWQVIVNNLLSLTFSIDKGGEEAPHYIKLTPDARRLIIEWQGQNRAEDKELDNDTVNGISAKIQTYCLRFSLIIQLLRWACDNRISKEEVDSESVKSAILLAKYFKATAVTVSRYINSKNPLNKLPAYKRELYERLPAVFGTKEGLAIADTFLKERAFKEWLTDESLFKNISHGKYQKVILTQSE